MNIAARPCFGAICWLELYLMQLHFVAAEILVIQAVQPSAELVCRGAVSWATLIEAGCVHNAFGDVDGTVVSKSQSNGVRGARINHDLFTLLLKPESGVEGVISKIIDDYVIELRIQVLNNVAKQIMGHGAGCDRLVNLIEDGIELKDADPYRHDGIRGDVFEDDNRHVGSRVHHKAADFDFKVHQFPLTLPLFRHSD